MRAAAEKSNTYLTLAHAKVAELSEGARKDAASAILSGMPDGLANFLQLIEITSISQNQETAAFVLNDPKRTPKNEMTRQTRK